MALALHTQQALAAQPLRPRRHASHRAGLAATVLMAEGGHGNQHGSRLYRFGKRCVEAVPRLAVALGSTLALRTRVWRARARGNIRWYIASETEVPDFDLNVLPPILPKRPLHGFGGDEVTRQAWRKIIYWARRYDRSRYGTTNRFVDEDCLTSERVVVLGAGEFGTAVAAHIADKGVAVTIVTRDAAVSDFINTRHIHPKRLSEYNLPRHLRASTFSDAAEALAGCNVLIVALPVQAARERLARIARMVPEGIPIVAVSKGIEISSGLLNFDLIPDALGRDAATNPVVTISGPCFAREMMDKRPTCIVAASHDSEAAWRVQRLMTSHNFRVSNTDDVIGVEVAGALKDVLAIAAGICEGLGLGMNAMSALVMQGNAEIRWLATAMGARPETLAGLAGMGDMLSTCFGSLSRNRSVGTRLGQGQRLDTILSRGMVAEGVYTSRLVVKLADKYRVLLPVLTTVARVLNSEVSPRQGFSDILSLPPLPESA